MNKEHLSQKFNIDIYTFQKDIKELANKIKSNNYSNLYGIARGGLPVAIGLAKYLKLPLIDKDEISDKTLIVDDLIDSGKTIKQYKNDVAVLYRKKHSPKVKYYVKELNGWIEFFYEDTQSDIEDNVIRILEYLGEDPTREGLQDTPKRYIKFLKEFITLEDFNYTVFDKEHYDEMIIQKDIPFFSLCEHHIAPFFGTATVAYIPNKKIVGLSKLARTVHLYAKRLQNQERITNQIAERLQKELKPVGVAVSLNARHFCMEMRGVKTHDVNTTTTKLLGAFKKKIETRQEFLDNLK
jgi:GTP cyclohydrolase I